MVKLDEIKVVLVQERIITEEDVEEIENNAKEKYENIIGKTQDN